MKKKIKLKIICSKNIFEYYKYNEFTEYFSKMSINIFPAKIHYHHILERKTNDFIWNSIFNFTLPDKMNMFPQQEIADYCDQIIDILSNDLRDYFANTSSQYVVVDEYSYGEENNRAKLITSFYRWQIKIEEKVREKLLWEHFEMEKDETLYSAVHFNIVQKSKWRNNRDHDFIFESYIDHPDGIPLIYTNERLGLMRKHSEGFLDTNSRKLAFGEVLLF